MDSAKKMKTGFNKFGVAIALFLFAAPAWSVSSVIVPALIEYGFSAFAASAIAFTVSMIASSIVTKAFFNDQQSANTISGASTNPGNRVQIPPATDNKLPVVYGQAWVGGIITDLSITTDNQTLYYVLSLTEVTNNGSDTVTIGDIYWGGKKCIFGDGSDATKVTALYDDSTGVSDTAISGKMYIYLYNNGSLSGQNTSQSAISVMQDSTLTYQWDSTKLMTNCAFAIIKLNYSYESGTTGLQQTKFQVTNSRSKPGDCFYDYFTNTVYGAAIPASLIDTASLTALNTYSDQTFTFTNYSGGSSTQARFRFDGVVDTSKSIMDNLQDMANCCDCLLKYNEILGVWGVIVQTPSYTVAMDINDSNMVSSIQVTPLDIASSYNVIESKFPNQGNQDAFDSVILDLNQIDPALLYPNEPVNKQSVSLPLVNNSVRAQYLATRMLKAGREDLQIQVNINFVGLQLEAGDVVTVTNANYGWVAKLFRIIKVTEDFASDGSITAKLVLSEYNASVYDDASITEFQPSPNSGIPNPLIFGTLTAPSVVNLQPTITNPSFGVQVTASSAGIIQYAEVWYSAFSSPTAAQRIFAGTTAINSNGSPFTPGASMGVVTLSNIPAGDWYFSVRMVNSLGSSDFSPSSTILRWRPSTFQYVDRYLVVAYADDINGTNISSSPIGKYYYGLFNSATNGYSSNPADYTWYLADPAFGTSVKLLYSNRSGRKFSFATGFAAYAGGTGAYVPTQTAVYDPSIWSALEDGSNYIDLDVRTGQLIETGTTTIGAGEIAVTNNAQGKVVASLAQLLDFGPGVQTLTGAASSITIDIYGRILGFTSPDLFYYTMYLTTATAGQTVFTPTARQANYITGCDWVFRNGILLDTTEYSENSTTVTLGSGAASGDQICIISLRAVAQGNSYIATNMTVDTVSSATVTYPSTNLPYQNIVAGDIHTFSNTGTPTQYTVASYNAATRQITYTATVTGVSAGALIYTYRANGSSYRPFSRWTDTLSAASSYTPTTWSFHSGYEKLFMNGAAVNDQDYDLVSGSLTNFPATADGLLTVIQFADNNTTTPIGNQNNQSTGTIVGQATYDFNFDSNAFELYYNGPLQVVNSDYTLNSGSYTLTVTPTSSLGILQQVTYQRNGAA